MKKKVMFFLYIIGGGGAERTILNIINNLDRKEFEPILVLGTERDSNYIDLVSDDVKIIILNSPKLRYSLLKLRKCIVHERPDILFTTVYQNNIVLSVAKIISFRKIPLIIRESNNRIQSGKISTFNKLITFLTYNFVANKVVALSEGVKKDLVKNFKIKTKKIKVIYNPIEVDKIWDMSKETVNDIEFNKNEKIIIAVGRFVEQKDYPNLLKAFSIVTECVKSRLIILGKGELENEIKGMIRYLNIEDKVILLGFKKNPYKYMRQADVFVLSSKWEGFGHVIVEAMSTGTPVISTNCKSGPAEIIGDNKYGLLVPVGNPRLLAEKIEDLLKNDPLREKYIKLGYERAQYFKASEITKQYADLFNECILLSKDRL